ADANIAGEMYPDQSLYPVNSVPAVVKRINNTFVRADQIQHMEGTGSVDYFAPIVADAEAGFGGVLNAFELMKAMIEAGAASAASTACTAPDPAQCRRLLEGSRMRQLQIYCAERRASPICSPPRASPPRSTRAPWAPCSRTTVPRLSIGRRTSSTTRSPNSC